MRNAFGLVCLVLGALAVLAQVAASLIEASRSGRVASQAAIVKDAATKTEVAAERVLLAARALPASNQVRSLFGDQYRDLAAALEVGDASNKAAEAKEKAKEAKEEAEKAATGTGKWDFAGALAGKVPLAVVGIVLIALGALILEYINLGATVTT